MTSRALVFFFGMHHSLAGPDEKWGSWVFGCRREEGFVRVTMIGMHRCHDSDVFWSSGVGWPRLEYGPEGVALVSSRVRGVR
jgi:hypothetical protein